VDMATQDNPVAGEVHITSAASMVDHEPAVQLQVAMKDGPELPEVLRVDEVQDAAAGLLSQLGAESAESQAALERYTNAVLAAAAQRHSDSFYNGMRDVVAHFFEIPCSWHQTTVYFVTTADGPDDAKKRLQLLFGSFLQVVVQIGTSLSLYIGTYYPSCRTNDQCASGTYCTGVMCDYCGSARTGRGFGDGPPPEQRDPATGDMYNRGYDPGTRHRGTDRWIEACDVPRSHAQS
jgi:hypothetical protein